MHALLRYSFDVLATAADTRMTPEQVRTMLQALLAERFQVTLQQREPRHATYSLSVAKNGPTLKKANSDICTESTIRNPCGGFRIYQQPDVGQHRHREAIRRRV